MYMHKPDITTCCTVVKLRKDDGDDTEDDDDLQIPVRHETQENISLLESPRCQGKKCALDGKAENED